MVFDPGEHPARLVFNGANAAKTPLIAQMAHGREHRRQHPLRLAPSGIGDEAYGNMLLGIPGGPAERERAVQYLKASRIFL